MEAFDHVATNDDTNRQVGCLNYFPLCRAVQVAFKTGVSRGKEGPLALARHSECLHLPSSFSLTQRVPSTLVMNNFESGVLLIL